MDQAPAILQKVEYKLRKIKAPILQVQEAAKKVEDLTKMDHKS
jgi:hypothetical protein